MARAPIHHPVLLSLAVTIVSVLISALVTDLGLQAAGLPSIPIAFYLSAGIPAVAVPLTVYPLLTIINRQRLLRRELEHAANTDALTGLPNRRAFFERAARIMAAPAPAGAPLTAMMIDVDHFKAINDGGGHTAGDGVLVASAQQIRRVLADGGASDWILARIGGDEFAVLVAGLVPSAVARLAERICREARTVGHPAGSAAPTVSIGVAFGGEDMDIDELIKLADDASYAAKRAGRDRWAFASPSAETSSMPASAVHVRAPAAAGRTAAV